MVTLQVHRFGDKVAIYIGTGATVYLTADEALQLGRQLMDCACDVQHLKFSSSTFHTFSLGVEGLP